MKSLLAGLLALVAGSLGVADAATLFESSETLVVTIDAPMRDLVRQKRRKLDYEGVITYTDVSGDTVSLPVELKPRGNHRLVTCDFPPLRLKFKRKETEGTVFEGQGKLKLVNPCSNGSDERGWLLQEYGLYRGYNILTDASFRVRRLEISYRDPESSRWKRDFPGFLIEPIEGVAERTGTRPIRPVKVRYDQFHVVETTNKVLYQYLIANTDFSMLKGPVTEGCCHNGRIISPPGREHEWIVLPYDFDQAGIINTEYALPDRRLGIRSVTTRLYRGFCGHNDALPAAIDHYNQLRSELTEALVPTEISSTRQSRMRRYIDRFYDTINDQKELERQIIAKCRGPDSIVIRASEQAGQ
jgi:hypothetical protein